MGDQWYRQKSRREGGNTIEDGGNGSPFILVQIGLARKAISAPRELCGESGEFSS